MRLDQFNLLPLATQKDTVLQGCFTSPHLAKKKKKKEQFLYLTLALWAGAKSPPLQLRFVPESLKISSIHFVSVLTTFGHKLKGHWTSSTSYPQLFLKKVGIFIPL